jgi:hypothetical protein
MMDKYIARVNELADEMAALLREALEEENAGRYFSQCELRLRFEQLRRINADLGQAQFDFTNDPIWPLLDEQDRQDFLGFVNDTIKGWRMIEETMS